MKLLRKLKPFDRKSGNLNVVIDTPKGSRNKYGFDFNINGYKLKTVLPHGAVFRSTLDLSQARWPKTAIPSTYSC
jgi:inorganic pyrophosphatase